MSDLFEKLDSYIKDGSVYDDEFEELNPSNLKDTALNIYKKRVSAEKLVKVYYLSQLNTFIIK